MDSLNEFVNYCKSSGTDYRGSEPLSRHSSLRIGGVADLMVFPDLSHIVPLMGLIKSLNIPYLVIGGGTNILFPDEGIRAVVVCTQKMDSLNVDNCLIEAAAGRGLWGIVQYAAENGLSGIEGLAGIPGTLGGAIAGNAGSFGVEIKDVLSHVEVLDADGGIKTVNSDALAFGYRSSALDANMIVLRGYLKLSKGDMGEIREKTKDYLMQKRSRQPVDQASIGCVFKNPEGLAAGRLIDEAGCKGMSHGGIMVSPIHANFFINTGSGTSEDYITLMEAVRERVYKAFGVCLEPEIRIVGGAAALAEAYEPVGR